MRPNLIQMCFYDEAMEEFRRVCKRDFYAFMYGHVRSANTANDFLWAYLGGGPL